MIIKFIESLIELEVDEEKKRLLYLELNRARVLEKEKGIR